MPPNLDDSGKIIIMAGEWKRYSVHYILFSKFRDWKYVLYFALEWWILVDYVW